MLTLKNMFAATTALVLLASASTGHAAPAIFTFNPGAAGLAGAAFTGDTLNTKNFSVVQITAVNSNGTANFTESGDLLINNVSLGNGVPFNPAGNLSADTLFVRFSGTGVESATNFNTSSTGVLNTLNYTLFGVAGPATFTPVAGTVAMPGTTTENTNGNTPIAIASGQLMSGGTSVTVSTNGVSPGASLTETVNQLIPGFFVAPANSVLDLAAAFNNNPLIVTTTGGGSGFTLNGGGGDISFTATPNPSPVPEPASMALLGAGLAGIGLLRRRRA